MLFDGYEIKGVWDELFESPGHPRAEFKDFYGLFATQDLRDFIQRHAEAEETLLRAGITFAVYGDTRGAEKIFPFDMVPRLISGREWDAVTEGLRQRIRALNLFVDDVYHGQKAIKDGIIPAELVRSATSYRPELAGFDPPEGIWIHVTGTDLIRDSEGTFRVLEDNLRCPSGVSYVMENRELLKRAFPALFERLRVRRVEDYPDELYATLEHAAPKGREGPRVAVLTPGVYNSAYFEHSFLARNMGVELVEGRDLVVQDAKVYMRTTRGLERVDVLYRRIDDDFLDPAAFRPDSCIGVRGLMEAYRRGNVSLANAPGTGMADDKAIYSYVPDLIKYYLGEEAIIPNVPTYLCDRPKELSYVLANLDKLVVKATNESGGYGMLMGHQASKELRAEFAERIKANPRLYIAQPVVELSQAPTLIGSNFEGRRVDLRPYILYGEEIKVIAGGLTRVALKKGSLVVNSSQGGGSKDTWVIEEGRDAQ
jgi:uncharacterized circularly permuted ATP-grasp superfamily protein